MNIGNIPIESILNIIFLFIIFTLLYMNPYKPKPRDLLNWWKLRLFQNPSIHRIIYPNGNEREYVLSSFGDNIEANYDKSKKRAYIMNHAKTTRRNKVQIFTHHIDKAQGVDLFDKKEAEKLDAEKYYNSISNARITIDLIKQLLNKKDLIKYIFIVVVCAAAAAIFAFQNNGVVNAVFDLLKSGAVVVTCKNAGGAALAAG